MQSSLEHPDNLNVYIVQVSDRYRDISAPELGGGVELKCLNSEPK